LIIESRGELAIGAADVAEDARRLSILIEHGSYVLLPHYSVGCAHDFFFLRAAASF
jgi:hypothetical protein